MRAAAEVPFRAEQGEGPDRGFGEGVGEDVDDGFREEAGVGRCLRRGRGHCILSLCMDSGAVSVRGYRYPERRWTFHWREFVDAAYKGYEKGENPRESRSSIY